MYVDDRDLKGCLKRGAARIELCREKERERGSVCIYIVFSRESFWEICQLMMLENKQVIYIDYKKEKKNRRQSFKVRSNPIKIRQLLD